MQNKASIGRDSFSLVTVSGGFRKILSFRASTRHCPYIAIVYFSILKDIQLTSFKIKTTKFYPVFLCLEMQNKASIGRDSFSLVTVSGGFRNILSFRESTRHCTYIAIVYFSILPQWKYNSSLSKLQPQNSIPFFCA